MSRLLAKWNGRRSPVVPLVVFLLCGYFIFLHSPALSAEDGTPFEDRIALQNSIEAGDNLSSRARKALFSSRTKQDKGEFAAAAEVMSKWFADHPGDKNHLLFFNWAVSQLSLDLTVKAKANLEQAIGLEPKFARAWLRLGEAAYDLKDYTRAAEAFTQGYELMPDPKPEILYYSAVSWLLAEKGQKSMTTLSVLLGDFRDVAILDWYQALVAAAVEADNTSDAWPWMENCLKDFESDPVAWYMAYQLAASEEDFERAAVLFTVVGYLRPLKRDEFLQLGDLYAGSGVPLQAARYYQQAVQYPESAPRSDDYVRLASAWMAAHRLPEAREVIDRGVAQSESVRLLALLGDLNYSEEKYQAAREAFSRCVELDAQYARGWLMGGYCSLELGDNAEARRNLQRAAEFTGQEKLAKDLLKRIP